MCKEISCMCQTKLQYLNSWKKDRGTRLGSFLHAQSVASSLFVSSVGNASSDVSNASKALDSTSETTTIGTDAFVSRNLKALTLQLWYSKRHSGRAAFPPSVLLNEPFIRRECRWFSSRNKPLISSECHYLQGRRNPYTGHSPWQLAFLLLKVTLVEARYQPGVLELFLVIVFLW